VKNFFMRAPPRQGFNNTAPADILPSGAPAAQAKNRLISPRVFFYFERRHELFEARPRDFVFPAKPCAWIFVYGR
jgi:hypothetical protein